MPQGTVLWDVACSTWFGVGVSAEPWLSQPLRPLGTAVLLPGRRGGVATPLMHWPASLLTQAGWSVLSVVWDEAELSAPGEASIRRQAHSALTLTQPDLPVLIVAKSLGTYALSWAVENELPGVWLTPLLDEPSVAEAVGRAQQPTLLVGGTADPYWRVPSAVGARVELVEIREAGRGLQTRDWRQSLADQLTVFDRISQFADQVLGSATAAP